ncbi:hypothetical protein GGX14DRAFT_607431 [Mycena pura]|uniref:Uncharacterized protein n=1 Tax=Mycena pura TaxID=153505 RepID=A0AAD6XW00_9AGAR|nr:hypothetical protein GGX14DRAFT_607431 [Mycena pura]
MSRTFVLFLYPLQKKCVRFGVRTLLNAEPNAPNLNAKFRFKLPKVSGQSHNPIFEVFLSYSSPAGRECHLDWHFRWDGIKWMCAEDLTKNFGSHTSDWQLPKGDFRQYYHAPSLGDNSTSTPATRCGRSPHHQLPTSTLPPAFMPHSRSDLLQGIHGMLQGLVERVSALEATVSNTTLSSTPARGLSAQRGRVTNAKRQRVFRSRNAGLSTRSQDDSTDSETIDPTLLSEADAATDDGPQTTTTDAESDASSVCSNVDLDKRGQGVLQGFVTSVFRRVCRVPDLNWPNPGDVHENPITGEVYLIPHFQHRVDVIPDRVSEWVTSQIDQPVYRQACFHRQAGFEPSVDAEYNKALCVSVAQQAARNLRDRECWPRGLQLRQDGSDPTWDFMHLIHCSKEAFRNLKRGWKRHQTPELVAKKASADRRFKRRVEKSIQSKKNAAEIAQDFNLTQRFVCNVAHAEYQSDEVSGPESDSGESKEAWKVRLLGAAGYKTDHASVSGYDILEVLLPGWRVENYGNLLFESRRRNSGKNVQKYLRIYTDRVSPRIPRYAPYNSAINQAWLEEMKKNPENATLLADWNSYPEPEGCTFDHNIPDAHYSHTPASDLEMQRMYLIHRDGHPELWICVGNPRVHGWRIGCTPEVKALERNSNTVLVVIINQGA